MKNGSTLFLKIVIVLFSLGVFVADIFLIKIILYDIRGGYAPILMGMVATSLPFFVGSCEALRLLNLIDQKKVYTQKTVTSLHRIKYSGFIISALYAIGLPYIFIVASSDDAPGVVLLGLIFTFAPLVIAVFASIFQKLLSSAINIKSENELTV